MNLTKNYNAIISSFNNNEYSPPCNDNFYDILYRKLNLLDNNIIKARKYVDVLVLEEKASKINKEIHDIFQMIQIDMKKDEEKHFEGIKHILNLKMNIVDRRVKLSKINTMRIRTELEPEVPENIKNTETVYNPHLEQRHEQIVKKYVETNVHETRQRILEIQQIQDLIGLHLTSQSERIDALCGGTKDTVKIVKESHIYTSKDNGRYARRLLFFILLSMSFVLLFVHLYYRN